MVGGLESRARESATSLSYWSSTRRSYSLIGRTACVSFPLRSMRKETCDENVFMGRRLVVKTVWYPNISTPSMEGKLSDERTSAGWGVAFIYKEDGR